MDAEGTDISFDKRHDDDIMIGVMFVYVGCCDKSGHITLGFSGQVQANF